MIIINGETDREAAARRAKELKFGEIEALVDNFRFGAEVFGRTVRFGADENSPVGHYAHFDVGQGSGLEGVLLVSPTVTVRGRGKQINMSLRVFSEKAKKQFASTPIGSVVDSSLAGFSALRDGFDLVSAHMMIGDNRAENLAGNVLRVRTVSPNGFQKVDYQVQLTEPGIDPGALAVGWEGGTYYFDDNIEGIPRYDSPDLPILRGGVRSITGLPERINWRRTLANYLQFEGTPFEYDREHRIVRPVLAVSR